MFYVDNNEFNTLCRPIIIYNILFRPVMSCNILCRPIINLILYVDQ
jgi:hypothetical protein